MTRRIIIRKLTVTTNNKLPLSSLCFAWALENSKDDGEATKSVKEVVKGPWIVVEVGEMEEILSVVKVATEEVAGEVSIEK